jgi:uncharacterized protein (DUF697 family)
MDEYNYRVKKELKIWQIKISKRPSVVDNITVKTQKKINSLIPEKAHEIITGAIKNMVKVVILGSKYTSRLPLEDLNLEKREEIVEEKFNFYQKAATLTGVGTGAGGLLLGLADFPILLSLKIKFLYEVASIYGFDVRDYRERLYILYIFQLAFSSGKKRLEVYDKILNWDEYSKTLPLDIEAFDWRSFQQEYRDYIDLAKMLQIVPVIGAVVGGYANYKLIEKLGEVAKNSYRIRFKVHIPSVVV